MMRALAVTTIGLAAAFMACSADGPPLVLAGLEITAPLPGSGTSAGYFELTNHSREAITIDRVSSAQYASVEMHETIIDGGVARMRSLAQLSIEPGETISFSRGGRHLMLMRPVGDGESATLDFHSGDLLVLSVRARIGGD